MMPWEQPVRSSVLLFALGCDPSPPVPGKYDTAATSGLDSGQIEGVYGGNYCAPLLSAETALVELATSLPDPGNYLVCDRVPVSSTADETVLFLSPYSSAQLTGAGTVVFAQAGTTVNASGAGAVVIAEADARVTVLAPDATVVRCPGMVWRYADGAPECPN